jgi:hypothetical protein
MRMTFAQPFLYAFRSDLGSKAKKLLKQGATACSTLACQPKRRRDHRALECAIRLASAEA